MVCEVFPQKEDTNQTRITIGGNPICYPGNVVTPTGSLELVKLLINSVFSQQGAKFVTFDVNYFYQGTILDCGEYARVRLTNIPDEFINEYNLREFSRDSCIYFDIRKGVYGLPQYGKLAKDILNTRLHDAGYYQALIIPGLWCHKWRPITFCLVLDKFWVKYVGKLCTHHLRDVLKEHYTINEECPANKFSSVDLDWDYQKHTFRIFIKDYIHRLLIRHGNPHPNKRQLSKKNRHVGIDYGVKAEYATETEPIPSLNSDGIKRVQ